MHLSDLVTENRNTDAVLRPGGLERCCGYFGLCTFHYSQDVTIYGNRQGPFDVCVWRPSHWKKQIKRKSPYWWATAVLWLKTLGHSRLKRPRGRKSIVFWWPTSEDERLKSPALCHNTKGWEIWSLHLTNYPMRLPQEIFWWSNAPNPNPVYEVPSKEAMETIWTRPDGNPAANGVAKTLHRHFAF